LYSTENSRRIANKESGKMYALLVLGGGRQVDALLLSASPQCLRVVIPGKADTLEFRMFEGKWVSETGGPMEVEAILAESAADAARVLGNSPAPALAHSAV
jgi:hypothetical protein